MAISCDNASNMDVMLERISESLNIQNINFDPNNQRVRCLAHVINLAAKKLISSICVTQYENEESFETLENDEHLKDVIYKVIKILLLLYYNYNY